jgi:heme/copper-type cytochrome/quinol oxidase subunit 2
LKIALKGISGALVLILILVVVGVAAGLYLYSSAGSQPSAHEIQLQIVETDPVNQVVSFVPSNITAAHGESVTLAVFNGDDEPRLFVLAGFNINQTVPSKVTTRFTFSADKVGTFVFTSKATIVLYGKVSPILTGYLKVTR